MKLLDFYSNACQPCKMMDPIIDDVVSLLEGLILEKINAFENTDMALKYGVSAVPTFVLLDDAGIEISRRTGLQPHPTLMEWITSHAK